MRPRVVLVEDDEELARLLVDDMEDLGYQVEARRDTRAGLAAVTRDEPNVVLTDVRMKGPDGIEFCRELSRLYPDLPVLVITAYGTLETAVEALRAGAYDFLIKPFDAEVLAHALGRAVERERLRSEVRRLRSLDRPADFADGLVGSSKAMVKLRRLVQRVSETDVSILIRGASGTGKELIARAIHRRSPRRDGPFVAVNCSAIPPDLLESELFGHTEGAFTGARGARRGLFREADGGTLLLDEIGELPLSLQPKLLRALQERRVRPVGGDLEVPFDTRIVSATHVDLEEAIVAGKFRQDLFYRINVVEVVVPPLVGRGNDVLLLAQHFLESIAARTGKAVVGFDAETARVLTSHRWPGNVRELQNCLERAVAMADRSEIRPSDLPASVRSPDASCQDPGALGQREGEGPILPLAEVERRHLARVCARLGGNKTAMARALGIDRKTLRLRIKKYCLE